MEKNYNARSVWTYIGLIYGLSWLLWLPAFFMSWGLDLNIQDQIFLKIGNFIPSIVATIILVTKRPKKNFLIIFNTKTNFKVSLLYYLIALVTMPMILVTAYLIIQGFMDLSLDSILWPYISKDPLQILPMILYFIVFQGPLGEEVGWRGYLLGELLKKYKFLNASIFLGILWACWHLPKFMLSDSTQYLLTDTYGFVLGFIAYMVYTIMLSIMINYLYLKSGRALLVALIFHAMANFSHGLIPLFIHGPASLTFMGMMLLLALWMVHRKDRLSPMNEKELL